MPIRTEPPATIASGQERSRHRLIDTLRLLRSESDHLWKRLQAGGTREETYPVFQRINELRRRAAEDARRIMLTKPVIEEIESARAVLAQMAPIYGYAFEPEQVYR